MNRRTKWIATGAVAAAALGIGSGIAVAANADDDQPPIPANALDHASKVALEETGGGHVTGSEVGDEEGYYEVEVTKPDGSKVDVHLDRSFNVIDASPDGSADEDAGEPNGGQ
jgi:uncharacterized membrane protein YkoI